MFERSGQFESVGRIVRSGDIRSHLKNRILVQNSVFATRKAWLRRDRRGGADFQSEGPTKARIEDLKRGTDKEIGPIEPKDLFEIASRQ